MLYTCLEFSSVSNIKHGFFTRCGGVSGRIFSSLNCGYGSSDNPQHILENRRIVAEKLGVSSENLLSLAQVHGNEVIVVEKSWQISHQPRADAMVTNKQGIALGILTADCVHVLFADAKNMVIGAAHAGWKGAFLGVIENTVSAMKNLGANLDNIIACIGPCIAQESY